jgi:hypothetical protein
VACRTRSAKLIIAKLDRLARNIAFVWSALEEAMSVIGPWLTPPCRPGGGPLTEVYRPSAGQAVDVVGAPAFDPSLPFDDRFSIIANNCFACAPHSITSSVGLRAAAV